MMEMQSSINIHLIQGEIIDRYGPSSGRYTSPVVDVLIVMFKELYLI